MDDLPHSYNTMSSRQARFTAGLVFRDYYFGCPYGKAPTIYFAQRYNTCKGSGYEIRVKFAKLGEEIVTVAPGIATA